MKKIMVLPIVLLLAGCNLNLQYRSTPQAWVDAPLDGMVLPLAPYDIVAHAADPNGISRIEFAVNGAPLGSVAGSGALFNAHQGWTPVAPGNYVIQARGMNTAGVWSEYAEVKVVVQGEATSSPELPEQGTSPGTTSIPLPAFTATIPIPTASPSPTMTLTPSHPTLTLNLNANCRKGPSQVYEVLTSLLAGQTVPIVGKNEQETWWQVHIPTGELCWISGVTGSTQGNPAAVPVVQAPPTPVPGCYVYNQNQKAVCTKPCPANAQPGGECWP